EADIAREFLQRRLVVVRHAHEHGPLREPVEVAAVGLHRVVREAALGHHVVPERRDVGLQFAEGHGEPPTPESAPSGHRMTKVAKAANFFTYPPGEVANFSWRPRQVKSLTRRSWSKAPRTGRRNGRFCTVARGNGAASSVQAGG